MTKTKSKSTVKTLLQFAGKIDDFPVKIITTKNLIARFNQIKETKIKKKAYHTLSVEIESLYVHKFGILAGSQKTIKTHIINLIEDINSKRRHSASKSDINWSTKHDFSRKDSKRNHYQDFRLVERVDYDYYGAIFNSCLFSVNLNRLG